MPAQDRYERYYAEKLWAMIPEIYHSEDANGPQPNALRQIVELIADQAAITRRSIDRLWEDQHLETCDDWAVPYIADLVGTRLLPVTDSRSRRVDVARTVHFRRRRGTPSLLEQLVRELSGWDVVLVEAFRRLARTPHRLDAFPLVVGKVTRTPAGGSADLRNSRGGQLANGAFDEFSHTPDVRRLRGTKGRYGISKLNFHIYRVTAFELNDVTPRQFTSGGLVTFTVDPSGRDVPLFARSQPANGESLNACRAPWATLPAAGSFVVNESDACDPRCVVTHEWQLGKPIPCRLLSEAKFRFTLAEALANFTLTTQELAAIRTLAGFEFRSAARLRQRLKDLGVGVAFEPSWYRGFLRQFVTADSAKPQLQAHSIDIQLNGVTLEFDQVTGADLSSLDCQPVPADPGVRLLIDPERGRFAVRDSSTPTVARYFYGFSSGVGAGGYTRQLPVPGSLPITPPVSGVLSPLTPSGTLTLAGSRSYTLRLDSSTPIADFTLQAQQRTRPYLRLSSNDPGAHVADLTPSAGDSKITLDGVWFASQLDGREEFVIQPTTPLGDFDWAEVVISQSTFDPGGPRADGSPIAPLRIVVAGSVKLLRISGCITGPIEVVVASGPGVSGFVETLAIENSIVDATRVLPDSNGRRIAISNVVGTVQLAGVTVFGDVRAERILATDSLVAGELVAVDSENSCFRFSAAAPGDPDRRPRAFQSDFFEIESFFFVSQRFGNPGYAMLSAAAPAVLLHGAESGSELGAFSSLRRPIRVSNIAAKVDEFKPIGVLAQSIFEGEAAAVLTG